MHQDALFFRVVSTRMFTSTCLLWEPLPATITKREPGRHCIGGTTTVIDFIFQTQGNALRSALNEWRCRSDGNAIGDYSFHMAVTDFNENTKTEIKDMIDEGITSFKTFMAYKGALMIDDRQMIGLMEEVKKQGGMVTVHATNGDMIDYLVQKIVEGKAVAIYHYLSQPEVTEAEASERFADMTNYTGCPGYIVHLTCEGALNAVRNATRRNQKVFVETCIQYLIVRCLSVRTGF